MSDAPVTLSQVAREAGVSLATASRAINGSATRSVREDLRERVLEAARRLAYSPDPSAQAMARGRTTALGLVVHDIADPYFSTIAAGVARAAERAGLIVTLASTEHSSARELAFVELARRQRSRAIILAGGRLEPEGAGGAGGDGGADAAGGAGAGEAGTGGAGADAPEADSAAEAAGVPEAVASAADDGGPASEPGALEAALNAFQAAGGGVALVGQPIGGLPVVEIANADGAADLARALHEHGYRRFAVLAGPAGHRTAADRTSGFTGALAELGSPVAPQDVLTCPFTRDGGYTAMRDLIARADAGAVGAAAGAADGGAAADDAARGAAAGSAGRLPELVFAVNDVMAVGAMAAVRDAGLSVPDDVAVAGFDDIHTLRDVSPGLTTVRIPLAEVGELATDLALGKAGDASTPVRGEVVLRESTPALAARNRRP
ncbi:LacI family DNA-binding transcriptional regulator [Promicromonospora sukumoe]|uniref:LacI family DNA-binding transcriptional regulator n=1 Tax=Promicromonospora sukumoe TaxID=88382 RepID=UPI00036E7B40|nr:LacI family DNA-binding transcriptional regulator [Promicromonospora sukumoe]